MSAKTGFKAGQDGPDNPALPYDAAVTRRLAILKTETNADLACASDTVIRILLGRCPRGLVITSVYPPPGRESVAASRTLHRPSLAAPYGFGRVRNVEKYVCGSIVTDPICGVSGNMGLPNDADAAAGQQLPRNAIFELAHATDLQNNRLDRASKSPFQTVMPVTVEKKFCSIFLAGLAKGRELWLARVRFFADPGVSEGSPWIFGDRTRFIIVRSEAPGMLPSRAASAIAGHEPGGRPLPGEQCTRPALASAREERNGWISGRAVRDRAVIGLARRGLRRRPARKPLGLPAPLPQFFATASVPCPYIPGRAERKLIVELAGRGAPGFYDALSRVGFRRSHRFAYRPACRACTACVPVRIAVERFAPTRSIRRVRNANAGLAGAVLAPRATVEQFRLFMAYQHSRHRDSEMAAMTYGDYRGMIEDTALRTAIAEFRDARRQARRGVAVRPAR